MAELFLPCNNPYDQLRLTAELIRTLRAVNGLEPGVYDASKGGLVLPDDLDAKKVKKDAKAEKKAEAEKAKAEAAEAKAEEKKVKAEAMAAAKAAKEAAEKEPKA